MQSEQLIKKLNAKNVFVRKAVLAMLKRSERREKKYRPENVSAYNFNISTNYSFSPYNPTMAAFMSYKSGVSVAGVCDFGTVASAKEFLSGCKTLDVFGVCGFEAVLANEKLGDCGCAFYGISKINLPVFEPLLADFCAVCTERAQAVTQKMNDVFAKYEIAVDYQKDVYEHSQLKKGGTITLKHVFRAVGEKIIEKYGKGRAVADFLKQKLILDLDESEYNLLCDAGNTYYIYDLIAVLRKFYGEKGNVVTYPDSKIFTEKAAETGVIAAYEYQCPYSWLEMQAEIDRTTEEFSRRLDEVKAEGFNAVCLSVREYSAPALAAFVAAVKQKEMLVVLTEKTEYPRTAFGIECPKSAGSFAETCALAIAGNSRSIAKCQSDGIFSDKTAIKCPSFDERLSIFVAIGRNSDD